MRKIKFIHTDLHLGSRLSVGGKYSGYIAEIFDNAIYSAFERVFDQAISNDVDFILISGDLYDQDSRSVKANQFLIHSVRGFKIRYICLSHSWKS